MKQYIRQNPQFSLCGLNCSLCPRFRTVGDSRCPGCGGPDFHLKHPDCGIISCSRRHGEVEYCFECQDYPCDRYSSSMDKDSFITYQNVLMDQQHAKSQGVRSYLEVLEQKSKLLDCLLAVWDNGRMKGFYCLAINLLPLSELEVVMSSLPNPTDVADKNQKAAIAKETLLAAGNRCSIEIKLRK